MRAGGGGEGRFQAVRGRSWEGGSSTGFEGVSTVPDGPWVRLWEVFNVIRGKARLLLGVIIVVLGETTLILNG